MDSSNYSYVAPFSGGEDNSLCYGMVDSLLPAFLLDTNIRTAELPMSATFPFPEALAAVPLHGAGEASWVGSNRMVDENNSLESSNRVDEGMIPRQTKNDSPCGTCQARKKRCVVIRQNPALCMLCAKSGEPQCPPHVSGKATKEKRHMGFSNMQKEKQNHDTSAE